MWYVSSEPRIGLTPIQSVDVGRVVDGVSLPPLGAAQAPGEIIRATHPVLGHGEFIYLQGRPDYVVGSRATWSVDPKTGEAYRTDASVKSGQEVGVAMAEHGENTWGWFQISGNSEWAQNGKLVKEAPKKVSDADAKAKAEQQKRDQLAAQQTKPQPIAPPVVTPNP